MKAESDVILKKDKVFISRINGRLKAKFAEAAKNEGLTMSEYFEQLLKRELSKRQLMPEY
jgi:antitoxin component of RelBE/YafQ-DinJ toxin-antitoxin module